MGCSNISYNNSIIYVLHLLRRGIVTQRGGFHKDKVNVHLGLFSGPWKGPGQVRGPGA
jgi:hypothetical protein